MLGQNSAGDFDQYSLAGVDFGDDYTENYGIEPTTLEGDVDMEYGVVPEGLGVVPEGLAGERPYDGLGGYHDQLGNYHQMGKHQQLGNTYNQLGQFEWLTTPLTTVGTFKITPIILAAGVGVAGLALGWFGGGFFQKKKS